MNEIIVVAPANTMKHLNACMIDIGKSNLLKLGYKVSISEESFRDVNNIAGTIEERASSINRAISDKSAEIIMAVFGGYNSNDLLQYIDFSLMKKLNKKLFGYSDITCLLNAYYAVTGGCAYHGPGFGTFCDPNISDDTVASFTKVLNINDEKYEVKQPETTASDLWFMKPGYGPREWVTHPQWTVVNEGEAKGILVGGNIESLLNLIGTKYCPEFKDKILLIESSFNTDPNRFRMWLSHLNLCNVFDKINGLLIGNFTACTRKNLSDSLLKNMLSDYVPKHVPILINFSSSHTDPILTVPIGGEIYVRLQKNIGKIFISTDNREQKEVL
ncbi:LD-carboxypeptidase [Xenorhabdus budapestensis]|uniref:LD-carboxypeptidase n=1 Tax=Xenorhabdus budapestensis TaxID=290110 RepID=A0ABX7VP75_XENBU|nr:LD-carboxypeptidase [Xenorhabdus budapestensis]QTL40384.1 LD-carboxypeptidase [Xenorhabdus budapestensis]